MIEVWSLRSGRLNTHVTRWKVPLRNYSSTWRARIVFYSFNFAIISVDRCRPIGGLGIRGIFAVIYGTRQVFGFGASQKPVEAYL